MPKRILTWDPGELQMEMLRATAAELERCSHPFALRVEERRAEGSLWVLKVRSNLKRGEVLDESLEDARIWWHEPAKGSGDILQVIPENNELVLRFCAVPPPDKGGHLMIYPARYLERLLDGWKDMAWVRTIHAWLQGPFQDPSHWEDMEANPLVAGTPLRPSQRQSFKLPTRRVGYLWGPPGTGKTHTLGYLLAHLLLRHPSIRVLLLSTTNSAVDQAMVSVDRALLGMGRAEGRSAHLRHTCKRFGSRIVPSLYADREHLLPKGNKELVTALAQLEARKPEPEDVQALADWKEREEELRAKLKAQVREIVNANRLVAMTTTRAAHSLSELRECRHFDLVVFDEASQVGIPHALLLLPLGDRVLFAGDPQQLSPVTQSEDDEVALLFGHSMFDLRLEEVHGSCFLEEQARMAEPICRIVSDVFYDGRLRVAEDCLKDPGWVRFRNNPPTPDGVRHTHLEQVIEAGTWSQAYGGPIRYASAAMIVDRLTEQLAEQPATDLLVLTPFRAQRSLIKKLLRDRAQETGRKDLRQVRVSTVHRAQGMECHTVFFDPVDEDCEWMRAPESSQLINVALSRAQAKLWVYMDPKRCRNTPVLSRIALTMAAVQRLEGSARKPSKGNVPHALGTVRLVPAASYLPSSHILEDGVALEFRPTEARPSGRPRTGGVVRKDSVDEILENLPSLAAPGATEGLLIVLSTLAQKAYAQETLDQRSEDLPRVTLATPEDSLPGPFTTVIWDTAGLLDQILDGTDPVPHAQRVRELAESRILVVASESETRHALWPKVLQALRMRPSAPPPDPQRLDEGVSLEALGAALGERLCDLGANEHPVPKEPSPADMLRELEHHFKGHTGRLKSVLMVSEPDLKRWIRDPHTMDAHICRKVQETHRLIFRAKEPHQVASNKGFRHA